MSEPKRPYYNQNHKKEDDDALALIVAMAAVTGIKTILKGAGEVIEFGVTTIINTDGSKTKKR